MKTIFAVVVLAGLLVQPAPAIDKVRISGTKKTVDRQVSSNQQLPHGTTSLTEKQVVYAFTLQRMAGDVPEQATVCWIVIREDRTGRFEEAARGETLAVLPLGRTVSVSSDPISLLERDWSGRHGGGTLADSIAGYGLRVVGEGGAVLAERCEPASILSHINWEKAPAAPTTDRERAEALREKIQEQKRLHEIERKQMRHAHP